MVFYIKNSLLCTKKFKKNKKIEQIAQKVLQLLIFYATINISQNRSAIADKIIRNEENYNGEIYYKQYP